VISTVLDTGPLVASFNAGDRRHAECARLITTLPGRRLLPSPVLTEVCWLLERRPEVEAALLDEVARGTFELVHLAPADLTRMAELVREYADFPLGAVDASIMAVAERFEVDRIATLDRRHFGAVKPSHVVALTLLP
jgi:predicted nucleic acid-binding protein